MLNLASSQRDVVGPPTASPTRPGFLVCVGDRAQCGLVDSAPGGICDRWRWSAGSVRIAAWLCGSVGDSVNTGHILLWIQMQHSIEFAGLFTTFVVGPLVASKLKTLSLTNSRTTALPAASGMVVPFGGPYSFTEIVITGHMRERLDNGVACVAIHVLGGQRIARGHEEPSDTTKDNGLDLTHVRMCGVD